jgi:hypothetical protein
LTDRVGTFVLDCKSLRLLRDVKAEWPRELEVIELLLMLAACALYEASKPWSA